MIESHAEFIDLWSELGQEAGTFWFNDLVHPSAIGHAAIATLLCNTQASNR